MRVYYKSFIRWIWLGALFMAAGGLIAACDRRYKITPVGATGRSPLQGTSEESTDA